MGIAGFGVGAAGLAIAVFREWYGRLERRRSRPVVVVHEDRRRTLENRRWVAYVHLTNESATTAFNIRFGVEIAGAEVAWTQDPADAGASRLNVLGPATRYPEPQGSTIPTRSIGVVIPDEIVFSADGDPDSGRRYWALYESPAGELWYTSNPARRSDDFIIRRVRAHRWATWWKRRTIKRATSRGTKRLADINAELRSELQAVLQRREQRADGQGRDSDPD